MNIQLQRLIRKYEFLLEDWQDVKEIGQSANQEMSREIHANKPDNILESDFTTEEAEEDEEQHEESASDAELKKLFRKVVVKCHPDKLGADVSDVERIRIAELYDQAIEAHDDRNWALMIIVAIKLGVELPAEADDMLEQIQENAIELEQKISKETSSVVWQFYHADEEEKAKILQNYLKNLTMIKELKAKKAAKKKLILGLGHPRTGTGYTAKLLQSWGLDVKHEKMGKDGTVDWSLAAGKSLWQDVDLKGWDWQHIIYCARDPRESIPSIVYTENIGEASEKFRKEMGVRCGSNPIMNAINSLYKWDQLITELEPNLIFRIEDEGEELFKYLETVGIKVKWDETILGKKQNVREHPGWDEMIAEFGDIPGRAKIKLNGYCRKYGYQPL